MTEKLEITAIGSVTDAFDAKSQTWGIFTIFANKNYIRVHANDKMVEIASKLAKEGAVLTVIGKPKATAWIAKDGTAKSRLEIYANRIELCNKQESKTYQSDEVPF
jgi:single-stranded DNA-binding protein